jgi:protein-S-isoprenylcysteine O-methyltransferase Ste14
MSELALNKPRILPPKGLLIALAAQLPILVSGTPLRPGLVEIAAGTVFLTAGVLLNARAERLFRRNSVGVCPFSNVPVLIVSGPYRFTRNPMYLGLLCLNLGATLLSGALANLWSSIALFMWLHYEFVLPEEVFLRDKLGAIFAEYARRVPRWFWSPHASPRSVADVFPK